MADAFQQQLEQPGTHDDPSSTEHLSLTIDRDSTHRPIAHFDETGVRVVQSLHWFHVASTDTIICYFIHHRRRTPAMKDIGTLDGFEGYTVHDLYVSYYQSALYPVACNAHRLRELIHAYEQHQQQ